MPLAKVARDLDLNQNVLRRWKQELSQHGEKAFPGQGMPLEEELVRLRRENDLLKREREILKSREYLLATPVLKCAFIVEHVSQWSVLVMCRILDVSPSAYYAWTQWKNRPLSLQLQRESHLKERITAIFKPAAALTAVLIFIGNFRAKASDCREKRVARLIQAMELAARPPLIRFRCPPSFVDVPQRGHVDGTLAVYELNRMDYYREVFVWACKRSCQRYCASRNRRFAGFSPAVTSCSLRMGSFKS